jgi:hypothetical protein
MFQKYYKDDRPNETASTSETTTKIEEKQNQAQ